MKFIYVGDGIVVRKESIITIQIHDSHKPLIEIGLSNGRYISIYSNDKNLANQQLDSIITILEGE